MGSRIHFEVTIVCNKKVSSRHSAYRRLRLHLLQPSRHICHKRLYFRDTIRLKEWCLVRILRVWMPFSQFPSLSKCFSFNLTLLIKNKKCSFNCSLKSMNLHKNSRSTCEQLKLQQWRENERYRLNGFEERPACIRNDRICLDHPVWKGCSMRRCACTRASDNTEKHSHTICISLLPRKYCGLRTGNACKRCISLSVRVHAKRDSRNRRPKDIQDRRLLATWQYRSSNRTKANGTERNTCVRMPNRRKIFLSSSLSLSHPLEHVPFFISWGHSRLLDSEFDAPFSLRYDSLFRASSGLPGPLRSPRCVASLGKPSSEQNRNGSDKKSHTTSRRAPEIKSFPSSDSDGVELDFPRRFPTFSVDRLLTFNLTHDIRCSRYIFCKSTVNKFIWHTKL